MPDSSESPGSCGRCARRGRWPAAPGPTLRVISPGPGTGPQWTRPGRPRPARRPGERLAVPRPGRWPAGPPARHHSADLRSSAIGRRRGGHGPGLCGGGRPGRRRPGTRAGAVLGRKRPGRRHASRCTASDLRRSRERRPVEPGSEHLDPLPAGRPASCRTPAPCPRACSAGAPSSGPAPGHRRRSRCGSRGWPPSRRTTASRPDHEPGSRPHSPPVAGDWPGIAGP